MAVLESRSVRLALLLAVSVLSLLAATASASAHSTIEVLYRGSDGDPLNVTTTSAFDRRQIAPLVAMVDAFPHGPELADLRLQVGTPAEVLGRCGEETMACYDPTEDRMVIDGEEPEIEGESLLTIAAHEYGHHVANNRTGGIWSALEAGTLRWSTYEEVCEKTHEGLLFPGNEGDHYWENPGEAFAQSYATLVEPATPYPYTPLLAPTATSLQKIREDVLDPVEARTLRWSTGGAGDRVRSAIGDATRVSGATFQKLVPMPYDGRIAVRLQGAEDSRYRIILTDPASGETLTTAPPTASGKTAISFADCGHRSIEVTAVALGTPTGFEAAISAP